MCVAQNARDWKPVTKPFLFGDVGMRKIRGLLPVSQKQGKKPYAQVQIIL